MKWLTPIWPYLAVSLGLFWFHNAWAALLGFHIAIVISLLFAGSQIPVKTLFKNNDIRWVVLIPGSTGLAITSHRPRNWVRVRSRTLIMQSARACAGFDRRRHGS